MSRATRVLVLGLDSCDKDLVATWIKEGCLPNFQRFLERGLVGEVRNAHGFEAGSALPNFYYGAWPDSHGLYDGLRRFDPVTYDSRQYRLDEIPGDPIWLALAKQGKRCFTIDTPYTYVPQHPNCTAILNWGVHVGSSIRPVTNPPKLREEVVRMFGTDPLGGVICDYHRPRRAKELLWFRDRLLERIEIRKEMTAHYMANAEWDFFLSIFSEAHCAGHHGWHLHDANHLEHDPQVAAEVGDLMKKIYIGLDSAIGQLVDSCSYDTTVVIYLSHGMGIGYSGTRFLDRVLQRLENGSPHLAIRDKAIIAARQTWARVWRLSPKPVKAALNPLWNFVKGHKSLYNQGFLPHREERKYFEVFVNESSSGIRINLAGRERFGIVQPGEEYEAVCAYLKDELSKVRKGDTGEPAFLEIVQTNKEYSGELVENIPDLIATWNRETPLNLVTSPTIGEVRHQLVTFRTGDHRPDGLFVALGTSVPAAKMNETVPVIDFAPTIASLVGADPEQFVGRPIPALCSP